MPPRSAPAGIFVTGTDTGVGKTVVACLLLRRLAALGLRAVGMKPVVAGVGEGDNNDVAALAAAGNVAAPLAARNPFAFAPAIAPHLAAAEAGTSIDLQRVRAAYELLAARADCVVVEGAGGVWVPLDAKRDMLDIALALSLPVLLVVAVRLGCLNHALLSAHAIHARGLTFAGWVANLVDPGMARLEANVRTLEVRLPAPRIATLAWGRSDAPQWGPGAAALGLE
ncbi:MAG TPA: dethiobiotin synthase [Casimicrobiaceae bacterium]|jgi:dethiobiotin synthetase|nr:dethiobiotin synthase [Casimicrobiaceae bacterium]